MKVKALLTGKTKRIGPLLLVIMVALAGGAAIASVYFRLTVPSMVLVTSFEIQLWNEAKDGLVGLFDFGTLMPGNSWTTQAVYVKNIGDSELWATALEEGLPTGFLLLCEYAYDTEWNAIELNQIFGLGRNPDDGGILPGEFSGLKLRFTLANIDAASGEYGFTICFDAMDTSTG